ncbi:MAG: RES family NAD+ phosphorylase [Gemmatimonadaceae bacterium]
MSANSKVIDEQHDAASEVPMNRVRGIGHRLVPSKFPPIGIFDTVSTPEDAIAAMRLESLTNDRLQIPLARTGLLKSDDWLTGQPGAQAVMAAFLHAAPEGGRFTSPSLGAWYSARSLKTAIAETVYHQSRRVLAATGLQMQATISMREWTHTYDARFVDLRDKHEQFADLYLPDSYVKSQAFGEQIRATATAGIVYDSVRHSGGTCLVMYRPKMVAPVKQGVHLEYRWMGSAEPAVVQITPMR